MQVNPVETLQVIPKNIIFEHAREFSSRDHYVGMRLLPQRKPHQAALLYNEQMQRATGSNCYCPDHEAISFNLIAARGIVIPWITLQPFLLQHVPAPAEALPITTRPFII